MMNVMGRRRKWIWVVGLTGACFAFCLGLGGSSLSAAQGDRGPAGIVTTYYDQILEAFADTQLSKEQLREKLQGMAREVFTFQIMAQMSLGRNWQDLDTDQQQEFVDLFTRLLENTYFQKIENHLSEIREYSADDLQVTDEIVFSSRKAEVQTKISYEGKNVPVHYRFVKMESGWKIYDVLVEEISLVQNYRSQFNDRLQKISVSEFLLELQNKVHKLESRQENASAAHELQEQRLG